MTETSIVIQTVEDGPVLDALEGRSFQVHVLPGGKLRLYPLSIGCRIVRCPVVIGGEWCGLPSGHDGKHQWGSGVIR